MEAVAVGRKILVPYFATHWAVQVGDTWYEVAGASKSDSNTPNKIVTCRGKVSKLGAIAFGGQGTIGVTSKSEKAIEREIARWEHEHPTYHLYTDNCQKFVKDFCDFLLDGKYRLPNMEAGLRNKLQGHFDAAYAVEGKAVAEASTGRDEVQHGMASRASQGPTVKAMAVCGKEGFGVGANASLVRAEASLGPLGVAADLNVNTNVGFHGGNVHATVLGLGMTAGVDGWSVNTPVAQAKCTIM